MKPSGRSGPPATILATAVVPWTEKYELDEAMFRRQVETIARNLTRDLYIFGTAGEGHAVSEKQFDQVARLFLRCAQEFEVAPMLGVISLSLPTMVERIARGVAMGCRTFQLSLPSWGPLGDREIDMFFAETCGRFPQCDFHLYNIPRTKRLLTSAELSRAAAAHPNFVAVKTGAREPAVVADLLTVSPRLRFFFTEPGYVLARRTHDVGLLISVASIHPERAKAFVAGSDEDRARSLPGLQAVGAALREVAAGRFHIDSAFDKLLFRVTDPAFPLRLLPPYVGATEEDFEAFLAALPADWRPAIERERS